MTDQATPDLAALAGAPVDLQVQQALAAELADAQPQALPEGSVRDQLDHQFVTFHLEDEVFAVNMGKVREIIRVPAVTRVPLAPPALDGVANLRGQVLPIVSLRRLLGLEERAADEATRAVIVDVGQPVGFVVDRVSSVIGVEAGQIEAIAESGGVIAAEFSQA
jgi:purine-binding chemotaxis protein CheW